MNIPNKVRISGVDYEVVVQPGPVLVDRQQCCGSIEYAEQRINIDSDIGSHSNKCITLLHEIFHAIVYDRQIDLGTADEEVLVDAFAKGMYQILEDNPDLTRKV